MRNGEWDSSAVYDAEDYLYLYEDQLNAGQSDEDAELVWHLGSIRPGARVLDLACGHGRLVNRLAALGACVVGLDISADFLARATADAEVLGVNPSYVRGDIRNIPFHDVEIIFSWFSAFGYHEDAFLRGTLRQARDALRPGGYLLLELRNRDTLLLRFNASDVIERGDVVMVRRRRYDPATGRIYNDATVYRFGKSRHFSYFMRMFSAPEIRDWLFDAGFSDVTVTDRTGGPLTMDSSRMIVRGRAKVPIVQRRGG